MFAVEQDAVECRRRGDPSSISDVMRFHRVVVGRSHQPRWQFDRRASSPTPMVPSFREAWPGCTVDQLVRARRSWWAHRGERGRRRGGSGSPLSRSTPDDPSASAPAPTARYWCCSWASVPCAPVADVSSCSGAPPQGRPPSRRPRAAGDPLVWKLLAILRCLPSVRLGPAAVSGARVPADPTGGWPSAQALTELAGRRAGHQRADGLRCQPGFPGRCWRSSLWRLPWALSSWLSAERGSPERAPDQAAAGEAVEAAIDALEADADPRRAVIAAYGLCSARLASTVLPDRRRRRRASSSTRSAGQQSSRGGVEHADRPIRRGPVQHHPIYEMCARGARPPCARSGRRPDVRPRQ